MEAIQKTARRAIRVTDLELMDKDANHKNMQIGIQENNVILEKYVSYLDKNSQPTNTFL
jgi:hypothetical protein